MPEAQVHTDSDGDRVGERSAQWAGVVRSWRSPRRGRAALL